jgi:hypothetical protein
MARTDLPLSIGSVGKGAGPPRQRSRAGSGPTAMRETPWRPADGPRASTTTATTAHTTTTTEDADGVTTVTMTVTAAGR